MCGAHALEPPVVSNILMILHWLSPQPSNCHHFSSPDAHPILPLKMWVWSELSTLEMGEVCMRSAVLLCHLSPALCLPQHRQQSVGWRSEPEVSMPCSECLISQTASVITAAQPAAGVFPNWQLQGVNCASLWLRRDLSSPMK